MKNTSSFDVLGIGNAIVDVLSFCGEEELSRLSLHKGSMTLIGEDQAEWLYNQMGQATECSGGSVANTLAGLASLGASCAFTGKVRNDQLGTIFRHDMQSGGVHFSTVAASAGPATARCLIFITPDGERTMNTFLGACGTVSEDDIDPTLIRQSAITYVEGYLWDQDAAKNAIRTAIAHARECGSSIAFTLSDTFCVERHRAEFLELLSGSIDILFANENELLSLFETDDFKLALTRLHGRCKIAAVTRSEKGCVVLSGGNTVIAPTMPVQNVVDTTGAGDLFASGFLYGITREWSLKDCAELGNACAGQIIQQVGARSPSPLSALLAA